MEKRIALKKTALNLRTLCAASTQPFSMLEYQVSDPLNGGNPTITWWEGASSEACEAGYVIILRRQQKGPVAIRTKKFEVPGVPFSFIIACDALYYRRNVEV